MLENVSCELRLRKSLAVIARIGALVKRKALDDRNKADPRIQIRKYLNLQKQNTVSDSDDECSSLATMSVARTVDHWESELLRESVDLCLRLNKREDLEEVEAVIRALQKIT